MSGRVPVWEILESIKSAEYRKICNDRQLPDYFLVTGGCVNQSCGYGLYSSVVTAEGLSADDEVEIVKGRLKSTDYVRTNIKWGERWAIFPRNSKLEILCLILGTKRGLLNQQVSLMARIVSRITGSVETKLGLSMYSFCKALADGM